MSYPASNLEAKINTEIQQINTNTPSSLPPNWTVTGNLEELTKKDSQEMVILESKGSTEEDIIERADSGNKQAIRKAITRKIIFKRTEDENGGYLSLYIYASDLPKNKGSLITRLRNLLCAGVEWATAFSFAAKDELTVLSLSTNIDPIYSHYHNILGFEIGKMKNYLVAHLLEDVLVEVGLLSIQEARYFKSISTYRENSKKEQEILNLMSIAIQNKDITTALELATRIHQIVIEENQKNAAGKHHGEYCADDANAGLILGEAIMQSHPFEAYRAFELVTKGSPFYFQAIDKMAHVSISGYNHINQTGTKEAREFLHGAIKHLADYYRQKKSEVNLVLLYTLLEIYCSGGINEKAVLSPSLFTKIDVDFSDRALDIMLAMADKIHEQGKVIESLSAQLYRSLANTQTEVQAAPSSTVAPVNPLIFTKTLTTVSTAPDAAVVPTMGASTSIVNTAITNVSDGDSKQKQSITQKL